MAGLRKLRGKYYVRVFMPGGKEKLLPTKTGDKKRAEAFKRQVEEREFLVKAKLAEDVGGTIPSLSEAADNFLQDCRTRLRPNTIRGYRLALEALRTFWGNPRLTDLTPRHLAAIREYLAARVNSTTVNINLRAVRRFLNWCVETQRLERLPGRITFVKVDHHLPRFFTPDEVTRIFAAVEDPKLQATFRVLAETGLRRSELFKCTMEDGYLHLRETKGRRERLVRLSPDLIPDFILATEYPYHPDFITHAFTRAIRKAGIDPKGRSLHSLRHTFALREYARTRDIYYVKGLLGHSSVTVTEIYTRFPEKYLEQVFGSGKQEPVAQAIQDVQVVQQNVTFEA